MKKKKRVIVLKGGPGSGHHGHPGLSGVWGGSRSSGADKGGGGGGKPSKKKPSKPKAKPKAKPKTGYEEDQNMRDYAYFQEHGHYPGEKKPKKLTPSEQAERDALIEEGVPMEEIEAYDPGDPGKTQGDIVEEDFQKAVRDASTFEDLPEEARETVREHWKKSAVGIEGRGYVEDVSEYGKGEPAAPGGLPKSWTLRGTDEGEHRSVKIRETDFGHMIQALSGETVVETEYLDYDFSPGAQTGIPGFGKMSSPGYKLGVALGDYGFFLTYGESPSGYDVWDPEKKEFIEEKCGTTKKKYGDKVLGKKNEDEDEEEED